MNVYAVILNEHVENNPIWGRAQEISIHFYGLSDSAALLVPNKEYNLTESIAKALGMDNEEKTFGVIVKVDSYFGYNYPSVWEWMKNAAEQS